jgi:phosphate transport system substrate-binding protein
MKTKILFIILLISIAIITGSCPDSRIKLTGAGATFPEPFYSLLFDKYKSHFNIDIEYHGIGSGGGIKQIKNRTVDFGASDVITKDIISGSPENESLICIPTCISAVAITYNIPGVSNLKFTPELIANIYLGNIKYWNDPVIVELNPELQNINAEIVVIHRQESSGTTYIFSEYLSKIDINWRDKIGTGKSLLWPLGISARGNNGIITEIQKNPNSIGYVSLEYSLQNKLPVASIRNKNGNFIKPDLRSVSITGDIRFSDDYDFSITNTEEQEGYPITSFTWILVQKEQKYNSNSLKKAKAIFHLLNWIINEGQEYTEELFYAPLPENIKSYAYTQLHKLTYNHKPLGILN